MYLNASSNHLFELNLAHAILLIGTGTVAGFINTLSGAGSVLTIPLLVLMGLPADVANGTNRVSVLAQSIAGAIGFDRTGQLDRKRLLSLVLPTLGGSLLGSFIAARVGAVWVEKVLALLMVIVSAVLLFKPNTLVESQEPNVVPTRKRWVDPIALFSIGIYGGFAQMGVGIVLLFFLCKTQGYDLLQANALKVVIILSFTVISVAVFVLEKKIVWMPAILIAVGAALGAQMAVRYAVKKHTKTISKLVFIMAVVSAIAMLIK